MTELYKTNFENLRTMEATDKSPIENTQYGDFIVLDSNYMDKFYKVTEVYTYQYKKEKWYEFKMENILDNSITYMEYENDDVIDIYHTIKELKLRHLNIKSSDLSFIVDEENSINYGGKEYYYEDDYKVKVTTTSNDESQNVYLYEFEADDGECLTIEDWDDSFEVFLSSKYPNNKFVKIGYSK